MKRMPRSRRLNVTGIAVAAIMLLPAGRTAAQEPRTGVTIGAAFATQYPDRFQEGCGNPAAVAPSVRIHHRVARVAAELGVSGSIQMPPGVTCTSDSVPLQDGDLVRRFDTSQGSLSVSTEARLIVTPLSSEGDALRLIGGGAWYLARSAPAWIVGAGYRPVNSWGAWVFDVEYWNVGVAYDLERFRSTGPREFLSTGRDWQGFIQVRAGITVWTN
jgi:hypothetical protein